MKLRLIMDYRIFPPDEPIDARVALPLSKSMMNRALVINALTSGAESLPIPDDAPDDVKIMAGAIDSIRGAVGAGQVEVNVEGSGSAMRFLTAMISATEGADVLLDGDARSHQRPIGTLVEALRWCGADITFTGEEGFPPLHIKGRSLRGGTVAIPADESSQYVSAVMMVAPLMRGGLTINLEGNQVSSPYTRLTADMMRQAGVDVESDGNQILIPQTPYSPVEFLPEADWSAASFWYEAEALSSGSVVLEGLKSGSMQPDSVAAKIYTSLGVLTDPEGAVDGEVHLEPSPDLSPRLVLDLSDTPDMVPSLAVTCAMIGIPFEFSGVGHLRIKECDRIEALRQELLKVGVMLSTQPEGTIGWDGHRGPVAEVADFDVHGDHRMAMALAPVAVYMPGVMVRDAEVVAKSYPDFWQQLERAGFVVEDAAKPAEDTHSDESAD